MRLILAAVEPALAAAWRRWCGDVDLVEVHEGSIFAVHPAPDAVVSPANSFGFMDGGIDAVYCDRFGWELQDRVRRQIATIHQGELVVGAADVVGTGDASIPWLVVAPTMRVPMALYDSATRTSRHARSSCCGGTDASSAASEMATSSRT